MLQTSFVNGFQDSSVRKRNPWWLVVVVHFRPCHLFQHHTAIILTPSTCWEALESEPVTIATIEKDKVEERRGKCFKIKKNVGGSMKALLLSFIGLRLSLSPPLPGCHHQHRFCCKPRDCCCLLCLGVHWVTVVFPAWSLMRKNVVTAKNKVIIWPQQDDISSRRMKPWEENKSMSSCNRIWTWDDRAWCLFLSLVMMKREYEEMEHMDKLTDSELCWPGKEFLIKKKDKRHRLTVVLHQ